MIPRRSFFAASAVVGSGLLAQTARPGSFSQQPSSEIPPADYRIQRGRIRQSVMGWCFNPMPAEQLMAACSRMGMPAMEGMPRQHYPAIREKGMKIAIVSKSSTAGQQDASAGKTWQ